MASNVVTLLPCPFCGDPAEESTHWRQHYGCTNSACGAYKANLSLPNWNMRPARTAGETTAPRKEDAIVRAALESVVKFYRPWRENKWPPYALTCNDALKALDRAVVKTAADVPSSSKQKSLIEHLRDDVKALDTGAYSARVVLTVYAAKRLLGEIDRLQDAADSWASYEAAQDRRMDAAIAQADAESAGETTVINVAGSSLMMELFNRMSVKALAEVPADVAERIGNFMVANGYRIVFNRWYLQAEPSEPERSSVKTSKPASTQEGEPHV